MLLETDGTVLMQGGGVSSTWYRLTPSSSGSYIQGSWSQAAGMSLQRLYYASNVLPDGRILVLGGEYSGTLGQQNYSNQGEIYSPLTNSWTGIATYPGAAFGDDPSALLPGGLVLTGSPSSPQTSIYNPATNTWSQAASKLRNDASDEETWVALPDGSILSYDVFSSIAAGVGHAQRYIPSSNTWVDAGTVPVLLSSNAVSEELGPAFLLPDGRVFFLGGNGNTAYYTPSTSSWTTGPVIPDGLAADDAPGAELPDGKILFVADTPLFQGPSRVFEFDPTTNTYSDLTASLPANFTSGGSFGFRMLMLPSGQVLINNGSSQLYVYTPDLPPVASGVPAISSLSENSDGSFLLAGTLLDGISEGATYGDDAEMATDYPIVRLTGSGNRVFYARTYGWSSDAVAAGATPQTTDFTLPPGLPAGTYSVSVVANGSASAVVSLTIPTVGNDPAPTIAVPAAVTPSPATGTTASLSVLGADAAAGESTLTYTWAATTVPAGAPLPSLAQNATNAAKNDTVSFHRAGTYTFVVTVTNLAGLSNSSSVTVTVNQTLTSLTVSPALASVPRGGSVQFSVTGAQDQFGTSMSAPATVAWSLASGGGTVSSTGLYTAPGGGTVAIVTATATTASGPATGSAPAYVLTSPWLTQDVGSVPVAGAAGDNGTGTFTVAGSGQGIAGDADSFRYAYQSLTGDGVIVAHIAGQQSASNLASAGVLMRADLTAGAALAAMSIGINGSATFTDRTANSSTAAATTGGPAAPSWVKLVRSGSTFTGFVSTDGSTWIPVGTASIALGATIDVGLEAASGTGASALSTATFDQVFLDATPTVASAASARPGLVNGTSTTLGVLGGDEAGEGALTYTWAATTAPAGAPSPMFAINATNAAKTDGVTFFQAGSYTFTVTITNPGGLSITSSVSVTVTQTPTSILVTPMAATLTAAGTQQFSALAEDQFGQLLATPPAFTWSVQGGGIGGTIDANGLYTRPHPGVGTDTVIASVGTLAGTASVTVNAGAATQLVVAAQPPGSVTAGVGFNVTIQAEDPFGNVDPTYGGSVSLTPVAYPGGMLTMMASAGIARFAGVTLDRAATGVSLQAVSAGLASTTTSAINVVAAPATQLVVTTQPAGSVIAGSTFRMVVQAEDPFGNTDPTFVGSVSLALLSNPAGAVLGGTLTAMASAGVATFAGLSLDRAGGGAVVQASSSGLASAAAAAITVIPAAAAQLVVSTQPPASITANQPFGLVVMVEDSLGNFQPAFNGSVTLSLANSPGEGGPGGTPTVTAVGGVATFSNVTLTKAAAGETLEASASGLADATTAPITVVAAAATQLAVTPSPLGTITAGAGFGVAVSAEDPFGNVDPSFSGPVTITLLGGPTGTALSGTTTVVSRSGIAAFSKLAIDQAGTGYTLQAASAGLMGATTGPFSVGASGPTQLDVLQQPPALITAGSGFGLAVVAQDAFGNIDPNFAGSVTLSLANNPGGPGNALGGTVTASAVAGQASFSGIFIERAGAGYTLQASSGSLGLATSQAITVNAGPASQIAVVGEPPPSVTAGSRFAVTVAGEDPYGNVDPMFSGSVTLALGNSPMGTSLGGTATAVAQMGTASFTDLTLTVASTGYVLQAASGAFARLATTPLSVTAAPATQLMLTVSPAAGIVAGSPFGLAVSAEDPYGNVDAGFAGNVSVTLGNNPAGDLLGGTPSAPVHQGVAMFADLTLDRVAAGDTLVLSSSGLTSVTTGAIAVSPAAATQLAVTTEPPASIVAGAGFTLAVTVQDPFGNAVPSYSGAVSLAASGGSGTLGGAIPATPAAGVATFTGLTLDTAGTFTLTASSGTLQAAASIPLVVSAAAPAQVAVVTEPPDTITAGDGFGLVALVQDRFGNTVPGFGDSLTVALANNPANDTLGGLPSAAASAGVALFPDLELSKAAAGVTLLVSSGTLTPATTSPLSVVAAAATQLVITDPPPPSITAGTPFGFGVAAEDRFGNLAATDSGAVAVALPGGTLTAPLSAGLATFTNVVLTAAASGVTLEATSPGLTPATTAPLDVTAAAASQLVVATEPPDQVTAGNAFGLVAVAEDRYGNFVPGFQGTVTVTLTGGNPNAALAGTLSQAASAGVAMFAHLILTQTAAGDILQVAAPGLASATTSPIGVSGAPATQLVISSEPPSSVTAGGSFGLVVRAADRFGNIDSSYGGIVQLALTNSASVDSLGGTITTPANAGTAAFAGLTLERTSSDDTLQASSGSLKTVATTPVTVTAAPATHLLITTQPPASLTAGDAFGLVIQAEDPFGNVDPSFAGQVALDLVGAAPGATLAGTPGVTAGAGVASFSGLMLSKSGGGYTLAATSAGVTGTTSNPINVVAAPATRIVIATEPPANVTTGEDFGFVALADDEFGNVDAGFTGSLSLTQASGGGSPGGMLSVAASAGVVPFADVMLTQATAGVVLDVAGSGLEGASTSPITVAAGAADHLVVTTEPPGTVTAGAGFGLVVSAQDRFGNLATSFGGNVLLTSTSPGGAADAPFGGVHSLTASAGVATFSGLTLDRAAAGGTIQAASAGLAGASSTPITVIAAPAAQLVLASQPPSSVNAGAGFGLAVLAEDPFGNVASQFGGSVDLGLASNPGGATLVGTLSAAAKGGVASFSGLTVDRGGSGYTLALSSPGLTGTLTSPVNVISPPAQVVSVAVQKQPIARHRTVTVIVVQFDEPLNATAATNASAYMLSTAPGKHHASKLLFLARTSYNPAANTVTLTPVRKLSLKPPVQLRIIASVLTDALGRPIDGTHNGQSGGDFVATLSKAGARAALEPATATRDQAGGRLFASTRRANRST
jgi:hypothetical protein